MTSSRLPRKKSSKQSSANLGLAILAMAAVVATVAAYVAHLAMKPKDSVKAPGTLLREHAASSKATAGAANEKEDGNSHQPVRKAMPNEKVVYSLDDRTLEDAQAADLSADHANDLLGAAN